jgi:hypothetical protein
MRKTKIDLVHTPNSWDEIVKFCEGASTPADAALAASMAWNFAVEICEKSNNEAERRTLDQLNQLAATFKEKYL